MRFYFLNLRIVHTDTYTHCEYIPHAFPSRSPSRRSGTLPPPNHPHTPASSNRALVHTAENSWINLKNATLLNLRFGVYFGMNPQRPATPDPASSLSDCVCILDLDGGICLHERRFRGARGLASSPTTTTTKTDFNEIPQCTVSYFIKNLLKSISIRSFIVVLLSLYMSSSAQIHYIIWVNAVMRTGVLVFS